MTNNRRGFEAFVGLIAREKWTIGFGREIINYASLNQVRAPPSPRTRLRPVT
jgi:hypothetical protein